MRNFLEQRVKPVQYFRLYSDLALLSALRDIFTETALTPYELQHLIESLVALRSGSLSNQSPERVTRK